MAKKDNQQTVNKPEVYWYVCMRFRQTAEWTTRRKVYLYLSKPNKHSAADCWKFFRGDATMISAVMIDTLNKHYKHRHGRLLSAPPARSRDERAKLCITLHGRLNLQVAVIKSKLCIHSIWNFENALAHLSRVPLLGVAEKDTENYILSVIRMFWGVSRRDRRRSASDERRGSCGRRWCRVEKSFLVFTE